MKEGPVTLHFTQKLGDSLGPRGSDRVKEQLATHDVLYASKRSQKLALANNAQVEMLTAPQRR